jgi:mRNA-degrading endonuclease RelE of RelBE toxin-antitoxin system
MDCRLVTLMNDPKVASSSEFWDKLSKLKKNDDKAIEALLKEYRVEATIAENAAKASGSVASIGEKFQLSNKAEKARAKLTKINQKHFDEFIEVINEKGPQGLYENPKRWHYEKLRKDRDQHTIRLDSGNRVLFNIKDGQVNILDMGNHITH